MAQTEVRVSEVIDGRKVGAFQILLITLCGAVVFLDGFDAQAIGFVAPALVKQWGVARPALAGVFSAGLFGLMLGALFIAPLADRIGRRPIIIVSTLVFGAFSLATAWAGDLQSLAVLRFLTGVGLGGCLPNAIALTSEFSPARSRSFLVMVMFNGFTIGSLFGGLVAAQMVESYGWQGVFVVGGVLPLLLAPVLIFVLPESPRYLVASLARPERIVRVLKRIDPALAIDASTRVVLDEPAGARMSVRQLFVGGRATRTLLLWVIFFASLLDVYLLVNWLPTAMNSVGASVRTAILIGTVLQVGGMVGALPLGWVLDRMGARAAVLPAYLLAAVCIAAIGVFASISIPLTALAVFGAGFGVIGGQTAANALAATAYPTEIRSTGVGWAFGVGRVGSIVGPSVAGVLMGMHVSIRDIFLLSAIPAAIGALAALGLSGGRERN